MLFDLNCVLSSGNSTTTCNACVLESGACANVRGNSGAVTPGANVCALTGVVEINAPSNAELRQASEHALNCQPTLINAMSEPSKFEIALYVVAAPLGNLGDITKRAVSVFTQVPVIACEDTRVTRDLLRLLGIPAPVLLSVREHNEREAANSVIARLAAGEAVAYASDAGTPAISDPGARLEIGRAHV